MCPWLFKYLSIINLSLITFAGMALGLLAAVISGMVLMPAKMPPTAISALSSTPQPPLSLQDYGVIVERNIFNHEAKTNAAALEQSNRSSATSAASEYILLGTVVAEPDSLALIQLDDGNDIFRLGEQLPDGAIIEGVDRNRIILKEPNGTQHQLAVENLSPEALSAPKGQSSSGIREIARNRWLINRDEVEKARSDLNSLLKSARMEPKIKNGSTEGFVVKMIRPKSLLDRLGLKRNDLVREVNGVPLNSPEKALQIFQQLREAKRIVIGLERRNKPISLEYTIE